MPQTKCSRCQRWIFADDTITFEGQDVVHADCRRPNELSHEERVLLFRYCWDHAVAECRRCGRSLRQQELGSDIFGDKTHLCPQCRTDLTDSVREHLYVCAMLPSEVRRRAVSAREASRKLVKEAQQSKDRADVLMRESEAAVAALREAMRRAAS